MARPNTCACCKHQRKKCDETCELAPYFPVNKFKEYQNAQKVFGTSNIYRIITTVEPEQRQATADSILMEGNARRNDPVHGCYGVLHSLKSQLAFYEKQLKIVNQQLAFYREREKNFKKRQDLDMKRQLFSCSTSTTTTRTTISSSVMLPSSAPSNPFLHHDETFEVDGIRFPEEIADLMGDDKNSEHEGYVYKSTLEEGADLRPFDLELIDQIIEAYNHQHGNNNVLASFDESAESSIASFKLYEKQIVEEEKLIEEEEEARSSAEEGN